MRLRTEGLTWRELDGEIVILDLVSSKYLTTNATGAFLVRLLAASDHTRDDLVAALGSEYKISESQAATDVDGFVDVLRERSLIVGA